MIFFLMYVYFFASKQREKKNMDLLLFIGNDVMIVLVQQPPT